MSGNALPGCGPIHIDEIKPTLTRLSDDLEFHFDLNDYVLGSTGKKEYSGDIDLVLDDKWWGYGSNALKDNLVKLYDEPNIRQNGSMVHLKYPISNFDYSKQGRSPRTGFVQIDFNFGDYRQLKLFYHSAGDNSKFKGLHRNIALASIAGIIENISSDKLDDNGRPVEQIRWKWCPKGLCRVVRFTKTNSYGVYNKSQTDVELGVILTEPEDISEKLLNGLPNCLDSLETVLSEIHFGSRADIEEQIYERIARNFVEKGVVFGYDFPKEISKYF